MNRLTINLNALEHNLGCIDHWMRQWGARWTAVTKVLCGHREMLRAFRIFEAQSLGDSRLTHLQAIARVAPTAERWYLRVPNLSTVEKIVSLAHVSLNSELETIRALDQAAGLQGKMHRVVIMIELGDLREGILPGNLVRFYQQVFCLPNIEVVGIGANLGCLSGAVPTVDQFMQLVLYRELLELKFHRRLPLISAGTTAVLPLILNGQLPKSINHFRIGEALFLGTNLITGELLPELRDDVVLLETEIVEVKEKPLAPMGETGAITPFATASSEAVAPGKRGYRALVTVGHLETEITGLTPVNPNHTVAGASSDLTVVNLGDEPSGLNVGDTIAFKLNYGSLLRLMSSRYVPKVLEPSIHEFERERAGRVVAFQPARRSFTPATVFQQEAVLQTRAAATGEES